MNRSTRVLVRTGALLLLAIAMVGCAHATNTTRPTSAASAAPSVTGAVGTASAASNPVVGTSGADQTFFDDFSYASPSSMAANGWIIRTKAGWPGVPGAIFDASTVKTVDDAGRPGNRLLQISATTNGTTTHQTQICQQRKFLAGTYAARVNFNDAPTSGPDGDQVVETFYLISPYVKAFDPNYSEVDNEYLPNGGWGGEDKTFYVTTWATVQIQPWSADNASNNVRGSLQGWHILVMQVADQKTRFYSDGQLIAQHGAHYYPRVPMSLNFNVWFIQDGFVGGAAQRTYDEQIDWVFHKAGVVLSPDQVTAAVARMRSAGTSFADTVPSGGLDSPCDL